MRNRKVLFLLFGIFLMAIAFALSRVCIAAPQSHNPPITAPISENCLDDAITGGDLRIVRAALERGYSVNYRLGNIDSPTLLIEAAGWGHPSIVQFLLAHGADVNARTATGETALWQAAAAPLGDDMELGWETIQANYVKVIHLLIDHGANLNTPNNSGVTPLGVACYRNRIGGVKALLDGHADLNHRDNFGKTPIEWASYYDYPEIVKMLLAHGAHVDAKHGLPGKKQLILDRSLFNAITHHDIKEIQHLLSSGADANCSLPLREDLDHMEMTRLITPLFLRANSPLITRMLLAKGADPNKCDNDKYTPLMVAVGSIYVQPSSFPVVPEVAQIMIAHGANVNARDSVDGKTALMQTHDEACLHVLIAHGADINARNAEGRTALMLLAAQGEYGYYNSGEPELLAHLLLAHGANLNIRNKSGRTVWQIAKDCGAKTLLNQLRRHVRYVTKQKQH